MSFPDRLQQAFRAFDAYNSQDPNIEQVDGKNFPKELLYGMRMTERLNQYSPGAPEHVQLAARCQHIGRWEIPRNSFPMDRKGYLKWRSQLALHHAAIASKILTKCFYETDEIEKVKFLLQKKQLLQHHPETQLLEDVICLVFIEHYLPDFSFQHDDDKVVDILKKTIKKMSKQGLTEATKIPLAKDIQSLVSRALE